MPAIAFPVVKSYPLAGVAVAQYPNLAGHVLHDELKVIGPKDGSVKIEVQGRIERSDKTGKIDLYFRFINVGPSPAYLRRAIISPNNLTKPFFTFADFRTDGVGTIAPKLFQSGKSPVLNADAAHQLLYFEFDQTLPVGASTRFFFLSSDAVDFAPTTGWIVFDQDDQHGYAAILPGLPHS